MFSYNGTYRRMAGHSSVLARRLLLAERKLLWVGRPASSQAVLLPRQKWTHDIVQASHCIRKQSQLWLLTLPLCFSCVAACV